MIQNVRDYSSSYSMKQFYLELIKKYLNVDDVNQLNIGLLGYNTEMITGIGEDTFNTITTLIPEIFPNKAVLPESIYNYASLFQIDNIFATPSEMGLILFVNEDDIIKFGTRKDTFIEFVLDSNMIIDVEGTQFMLDYDIKINVTKRLGEYIYMASYDLNFNNTISNVVNPYIKIKRINYNGIKYLGLLVKVRQVNKFIKNEHIITNDKINYPMIPIEFSDYLANFEVFYKPPDSSVYTQLQKKIINSPPLKEPFCYYSFKYEGQINISFTPLDYYFQPKFNSEILIYIYNTIGSKGNFPLYIGNNILITPKSEIYDYNNNIVLFAIAQTESKLGADILPLDELQKLTVEKFSTVESYTNENDLQMYFDKFKYVYGADVLFTKRRNDPLERLFGSFIMCKEEGGNIYSTNTIHLKLNTTDFDLEYEQSGRLILKPGHLFKYVDGSIDTGEIIPALTINDDLTSLEERFLYTNPFLITLTRSPAIIGFFLNSLLKTIQLEYSYVNSDSIVQFICNNLNISRNSLIGEDNYKLTINMIPTFNLNLNNDENIDINTLITNTIKAIGVFLDGNETCYIDFNLTNYDEELNLFTFEAILTTDDYVTLEEKFSVIGVKDIITSEVVTKLIPMNNSDMNIYVFYKYDNDNMAHKFDYITDLQEFTLTNIYSTGDEKIDFIKPLSLVTSRMKYIQVDENNYYMILNFIPFIKAETVKDNNKFIDFINKLFLQYKNMEETVNLITNNYSIDVKFYNTYGHSKNFVVGEEQELLDRVNCSIWFKVKPIIDNDEESLILKLKLYIKDYIESINIRGNNSFYVSNLITAIKNDIKEINYLKFVNINNYDSSVQVIENKAVDITTLSKDEQMNFIPEYLTINIDDIIIEII